MGRKPTRNKNLPAGMRARHRKSGTYFYLDTGQNPRKEIPLGKDYTLAVKQWAELTIIGSTVPELVTFRAAAERYVIQILPTKASSTQKLNLRELAKLYEFFDNPPAPLDQIEPINVRQYLNWRAEAKIRANREKALFSHIFNFAREAGLTSKPNPCAGIRGFKETGRDNYVCDATYSTVWEAADWPLRDALDLAYLTGQRPADVLKFSFDDIKDGALQIVQNKTGKKLRIMIIGRLLEVIERLRTRISFGNTLIANQKGYPMSKSMLRGAFERARIAAIMNHPGLSDQIKAFQFRDIRAKAATDTEQHNGLLAAQDQLGHSSSVMTSHYVRHRLGKLVKPTK